MAGRILNRRALREQADQVQQSEALASDTPKPVRMCTRRHCDKRGALALR